ncbi:MAG TPA: beta-ketoacyl synthase N-terminal-like domain-containing protein, partial [Tepidisphaeraceae bacterium]|nr:beta-ketoacyl synthase N-terminal-like domain-containing protein [Tepidisphaeraceae bacterium]
MNVCITGLGLITPLGSNCDETFDALLAEQFIQNDSLAKFPRSPSGGCVNALTLAAARQAMMQAGWKRFPEDCAIVAGTSKGDVESWLTAIDQIQDRRSASFSWNERLGLGDLASTLADGLDAGSCVRLTYSAACASGLDALARAAMMIQFGEARSALVVAAESSLHSLFVGCFKRLGVLAP